MYKLNQVKLNIKHSELDLRKKVSHMLKINVDDINWSTFIILHKSIDARDKKNICYVYNVAFELNKSSVKNLNLDSYEPVVFDPVVSKGKLAVRPIVVGFGPAGIFASYIFALNGLKPIIYERGKKLSDRIKDTQKFFDTMELDEESNVCFGEGGAGAFSDGKLNTNNKDKTGVYRFILDTLVKFGASENILYENMPHIGTDKLTSVIENIRNEILRLGGEIHYSTKWKYSKEIKDTPVVLAIGNSARDTFRDLHDNGFALKEKTIAVGYRIAHEQKFINEIQYGSANLPPAIYKLTYNLDKNRSVYSFCMCPGGYIINSSNTKGKLSINGMSYSDRGGLFANSAIVVTVRPEDVDGSMIEFQEKVEKKAYELENGFIPYTVIGNNDIDVSKVFKGQARYVDEITSLYKNVGLKFDINECIKKGLDYFNKIMPGFYSSDIKRHIIIAGVETRTSSPVSLDRDNDYMCNIKNFYPCGEGLGHGGGIMSSAADGVNVALKVINSDHYI